MYTAGEWEHIYVKGVLNFKGFQSSLTENVYNKYFVYFKMTEDDFKKTVFLLCVDPERYLIRLEV